MIARVGAGLFIAATIALVGYGVYAEMTAPDTGTILDRSYRAAYTTTSQTCSGTGTTRTCTPTTTYYPESYRLELRDGDNQGWRSVAPVDYQACAVGDTYPECAGGRP